MAVVDVVKLNKTLVNKLTKFCKAAKCSKGEIRADLEQGMQRQFSFEFENDGMLAPDLVHIIKQDPRAVCVFAKDFDGVYDWKSDTYFKPSSMVTYHF
jgi:hypothetical protein